MGESVDFDQLAQALVAQGIDPVVELAKVLKWQVPTFEAGKPVMDELGQTVMTYAVDLDTRTRILATLVALSEMAASCERADQAHRERAEEHAVRGAPK